MPDDLVLNVKVNGADAAAAGVDKVGAAVTRTGATWDRLKAKLGSGEVLRNAAASAALLGTGSGNATQKIAALGGALAAIPGPVGIIASVVAVAATVMDTFAKSAEEAEKKAAELAKTLADLGKQKLEAQGALAERIGGAVAKGGKDLRAFAMTPGAGQYKGAFDALMPGNGPGAAAMAAQLAASGASEEEKQRALDAMKLAREAGGPGSEMSPENLARALASAQYNTQAFGGTEQEQRQALLAKELALAAAQERGGMSGLGFGFEGRRVAADYQSREGALDVLGGAGSGVEAAGRRVSAAESPLGKVINDLLAKGEAPAVAEGGRLWADAMAAGTEQGGEALRIATEKASTSTNLLRISIDRLDTTIREKGGGGAGGAPVERDADQTFTDATSYGRKFAEERNR